MYEHKEASSTLEASRGRVEHASRLLRRHKKLAGATLCCLLSLVACVLLARRLTHTGWPLQGAERTLVLASAGAYLASFGFRALGWRQLFPQRERPGAARCLTSCGAAAASGAVLPFRLDYVVKVSVLNRLGGVRLGLGTIALSIVALGLVDSVAMLPLLLLGARDLEQPRSSPPHRRRPLLPRLSRNPCPR